MPSSGDRSRADFARRRVSAESFATLGQIFNFRAVFGRTIEWNFDAILIGERNVEARAEDAELFFVELFLLVRDVFAFTSFAEAVALDRAGEDDGRAALVFRSGFVGGVNFPRIVTTETQAAELFVAQRFDKFEQARIGAEETLADVRAGFHDELLVFAVNKFAHTFDEQTFGVAREDVIPLGAPENLDDVPACAAESGLEFLNDLAVTADRAVEALQVAVDDEDEVVELFTRGERDGAERFGLVGLAVAEEGPHFCVGLWLEAAVFEITSVAGLVDSHQRAQAHRDGGIFPEVGHQPWVRIGAEAAAGLEFAAKIFELLRREATFKKSARVNSGRCVALEVDGVAFE